LEVLDLGFFVGDIISKVGLGLSGRGHWALRVNTTSQ